MPDLRDGEVTYIQGSARDPYQLKNVAGVYSCTCPAWRNQSLPIDRRTCKHIRSYRTDAAEQARVGVLATSRRANDKTPVQPPPLLLAETWDRLTDPAGYLLSEKLDGVRCWWDGRQFVSRNGNRYHAPDWFYGGLPLEPMDGELWIGRKQFQRTVSIVRRQDAGDLWREVRFVIFDAPAHPGGFEERLDVVDQILDLTQPPYAVAHPHIVCQGREHLQQELANIEAMGGEGLMLRQPGAQYCIGRSSTLLKVKRFLDAEAVVVGHAPGAGRHQGRLGALVVEIGEVRFQVGSGLSDAERDQPPPIGSVITFKYQELSDNGVPRFPTYVRVRGEVDSPIPSTMKGAPMASSKPRRFEFQEGRSAKFWEISQAGCEVTVRFGRIGASGQGEAKTFPDPHAASKHADKKVREKLAKGYREVG